MSNIHMKLKSSAKCNISIYILTQAKSVIASKHPQKIMSKMFWYKYTEQRATESKIWQKLKNSEKQKKYFLLF